MMYRQVLLCLKIYKADLRYVYKNENFFDVYFNPYTYLHIKILRCIHICAHTL